jgi:hypothetical protein
MNSRSYIYGISCAVPVSFAAVPFMTENLAIRHFSNFDTATVKDPQNLGAALRCAHRVR